MSAVFDDAQPEEKPVRRPLALRGARVAPGSRGDWSCLVWVRSEAEAIEVAGLINEHVGRKLRAEPDAP
jgi:hypothetical protein